MSYEDIEEDSVEVISESESYERFDDFLDEIHGTVYLGDFVFSPSRVLKECDPIAYQESYNNWLDMNLQEGSFKLED